MPPKELVKPESLSLDLGSFDDFVKEGEFPRVPDGTFKFRIKDWGWLMGNDGEQKIDIIFEVIDSPDPEQNGKTAKNRFSVTGEYRGYFSRFIASVHSPKAGQDVASRWNGGENLSEFLNDLIGLCVIGEIITKESDGKKYSNFAGFYQLEG